MSELDGTFKAEAPISNKDIPIEDIHPEYSVNFSIVSETQREKEDITTPEEDIKEIVFDNGKYCVVTRYYKLVLPYKVIEKEVIERKLIYTYAWHFKGCTFTGCNP